MSFYELFGEFPNNAQVDLFILKEHILFFCHKNAEERILNTAACRHVFLFYVQTCTCNGKEELILSTDKNRNNPWRGGGGEKAILFSVSPQS